MPEGPELPDNHHVNTTPKSHILTHTTTNNLIKLTTSKHTFSDECIQEWIGDGLCEDENNVPQCDYDGGECCGIVDKKHCKECKCKDPSFGPPKRTFPDKCIHEWIGDGLCEDENNVPECDYDGGDCCIDTEQKHCQKCECIQ